MATIAYIKHAIADRYVTDTLPNHLKPPAFLAGLRLQSLDHVIVARVNRISFYCWSCPEDPSPSEVPLFLARPLIVRINVAGGVSVTSIVGTDIGVEVTAVQDTIRRLSTIIRLISNVETMFPFRGLVISTPVFSQRESSGSV
jgi:hypothetical protein